MKPTICRCCGEPMPVQTEGNVNMCETCEEFNEGYPVSFKPKTEIQRLESAIRKNHEAMETALKCIDDGNYHLAHVVLRDQLEKLTYEHKGS